MKKIIIWFLVVSCWLFFGIFEKVFAEEIKEFSSKIYINKEGTIDVEETIVYDFGALGRHGIFREIPFIKKNQEGKKYVLEFKNFKVVDEKGLSYRFVKSKQGGKIKLKIGDPNKTITGSHTYIISYQVAGALTYFSDHDELYWNVTGNDWLVGINSVETNVFLSEKIDENQIKSACYTGFYSSKARDCIYRFDNDHSQNEKSVINFSSLKYLRPGEGLTIVVGFPKNVVSVLEPKEYKNFWESFWGKAFILILFLVIIYWYVFYSISIIYRWFKYGRDPKVVDTGEVTAWFDPPKTPDGKRFLTPAEVGVLGDETVDLKDISATIVDLARRGYLRIEERKKDEFWLIKRDKSLNDLLQFEKRLLEEFFKEEKEINLKEKNLYEETEKVKKEIYNQVVEEKLFPENPQKIQEKMSLIAFLAFVTGNFFLVFVALVFGKNLPRKTIEGVKAKLVAFSLRNFLKSQERQLAFQADKQMMFEKLLPYAVVFGVEKIWAKRFADLDLKPPAWYQAYDQRGFNSIVFTNSLNSSLSSFRSSAAPPTSTTSTSGFSSGFSGGSSGGGGGGGGGGSW